MFLFTQKVLVEIFTFPHATLLSVNKCRSSESYGLAVEHSAHDRKVVGSIPVLDGNGVKAMPGSIPAPNPGSYNNCKKEWK